METTTNTKSPVLLIAIVIYALAIIAANLTVAVFGPSITPINAFVLIGLDLALRDWLHLRLKTWQMGCLIFGTGLITYVLNQDAGRIAFASSASFVIAAVVDWQVFRTIKGSWLKRSNVSNTAGAAVDSLLFPTIAFDGLMPEIVALQFVAKTVGGAIWAWTLAYVQKTDLRPQ